MKEKVNEYLEYLKREERSMATSKQYQREIMRFLDYAAGRPLAKELVIQYKETLQEAFQATSVNAKLAAINGFFSFMGRDDLKVRQLRIQRNPFCSRDRELTKAEYLRSRRIFSGPVFVARTGRPLDRCKIWKMMKALCRAARVNGQKVFPHNLRRLFARCFYSVDKDIAKLAGILGHSNINTTRIYIMGSGREHRQRMDALGLIV